MMKYQLVLQWRQTSLETFDELVGLEELLEKTAADLGELDGHDAGSGEVNIFFSTDAPGLLFERLQTTLASQNRLASTRIAFRDIAEDSGYVILWPADLDRFTIT
jgi:hypothetical protein